MSILKSVTHLVGLKYVVGSRAINRSRWAVKGLFKPNPQHLRIRPRQAKDIEGFALLMFAWANQRP